MSINKLTQTIGKSGFTLAFAALAVGLLLSVAATQAQARTETVIYSGNNATAIKNLEVNGVLYDVLFRSATASEVYGTGVPEFDFFGKGVIEATVAVVNALNRVPAVMTLGPAATSDFFIGFEFESGFIFASEGFYDADEQESAPWLEGGPVPKLDLEVATYADFTALPGSGNQPPVADANGPYPGTINVAVTFDGSGSSDLDGSIVSYDWDFGDGTTGSGATPSHTYTAAGIYNVTLTVTDDSGATDSDGTAAAISSGNLPPVADANGPHIGTSGVAVSFDGTGSSDLDGSIASYDWDFGDGSTGSGATPDHTYAADGVYTVTLTVTDNDGATDSDDTAAVIGTVDQPPAADANGPYTGASGVALTFDGTGSNDPDGSIVSYDWDFGDGNTGTGATPSHTYAADGNYAVTLTVTDDNGATDSDGTAALIGSGNLPPVADAGGPYLGVVNTAVTFDGTASSDPDGSIASYNWDFGDGATGTGATPSHTYAAVDTYTVTLTVTDDDGVVSSDGTAAVIDEALIDLSGTVEDAGGTPLCSLVLASGQFMFSCNPNGPFSLTDLPRENDGTVKQQVYVDGFFPNVQTLPGSVDETVVMTRANNCPDYNSFPDPGVFPDSAGKRIDISGTVLLQDTQTPICAMALANGQFGFTCDGTGTYAANIPLDANGQYKLQVYADGFAPMVQAFDEFSPAVEVRMARGVECQ